MFILTYTCVCLLTTPDNGPIVKNCFSANPLRAFRNWQPERWIRINCMWSLYSLYVIKFINEYIYLRRLLRMTLQPKNVNVSILTFTSVKLHKKLKWVLRWLKLNRIKSWVVWTAGTPGYLMEIYWLNFQKVTCNFLLPKPI